MKQDKDKIWHDVLESIKVSVSSAIFNTWISKTHLVSLKKVHENRYAAQIGCASFFVKSTIGERYYGLVQDSLIKAVGTPCDIELVVKENASIAPPAPKTLPSSLFQEEDDKNELLTQKLVNSKIRLGFNFENFAVSPTNQLAWAAAEAVAQKPGRTYNPLFIWGGVGVGKTHLMHAVGYTMIKRDVDTKIIFCSAEEFVNDIVEGIKTKSTQNVRSKYRKLNALFVDDIQFIAGKETVQEEFFHTFNAVISAGGQIILTSDKPPSLIPKIEERLKSRFEAGLTVDISEPDFELKCAIVQIKAKEQGSDLEMPLVQLIAGNIGSARQIQGFLTRLFSESKLNNLPITEDLVKSLLSRGEGVTTFQDTIQPKTTTPDRVIQAVSSHFSVSKKALMGKTRTRLIARPRQILMYILRIELGLPFEEVGRIIGGRDHTTVMHAVDTITHLASQNVQIREDLKGIKNTL